MVDIYSRWAALLVTALIVAACGATEEGDPSLSPGSNPKERRTGSLPGDVFLGRVAGHSLLAIHVDRKKPKAVRLRILAAGTTGYDALEFEGVAQGETFSLESSDGEHRIDGRLEPSKVDGSILNKVNEESRPFFTRPAPTGAGIFDVTIAPDGTWTGTSLSGATLRAARRGDLIEGSIEARGARSDFKHVDLTRRPGSSRPGDTPGSYVVVVDCGAAEIQGESVSFDSDRPPGAIALDLDQSAPPTAGVYQGRVSARYWGGQPVLTAVRIALELTPVPGGKRLRAYVAAPMAKADANIQWFEGPVAGDEFTIVSSSGDATLTGRLTAEGISGELNLPDKSGRNYFAPPAGEGAGIYTVQVTGDRRHAGASEQGAKLDLRPDGDAMAGTIFAPDGTSFDVRSIDSATAYRSGDEYGRPDTYVALVAPRGRYVFGRSAELRSGRPATNLVSLEKRC